MPPDSDNNHHNIDNVAYVDDGTLGHFPTIWKGTPQDEPSGPTHGVDYFQLGFYVNAEQYADVYFPASNMQSRENLTNILSNGELDMADNDLFDDGWWNEGVPMLNCEQSMLIIAVSQSDLPTDIERLWLNVWFDGNRDGDWNDTAHCTSATYPSGTDSYEWIVQDYAIDIGLLPGGDDNYLEFYIPTVPILNQQPERDAWVRLTLSEQKALVPPDGSLPDGRGPRHPAIFAVGETEDYLLPGIETVIYCR